MNRTQQAAIVAGLFSLAVGTDASAQTARVDRKPTFSFSVANLTSQQQTKGPLFQRVSQAFAAAIRGDGSGFEKSLAKNAELTLLVHSNAELGSRKLPFNVQTIRAATNSCFGPYSFDEGSSWAQLSWICSVDADSELAKIMTFRDSPELTITVWFENGLIKEIDAMEPIPVPGMKIVSMDAYAAAKSKQ